MTENVRLGSFGAIREAQTFGQLGSLVLDGSGTMTEPAQGEITKAQAANNAVREMFTRSSVSRYRKNLSFAVITFDEEAKVHTPITPATEIDDNGNFHSQTEHGGGARMEEGLKRAKEIEEIRSNRKIKICTTYFATVGKTDVEAQNHLRALASDPTGGYKTVYDAESLHKFFIASLSTALLTKSGCLQPRPARDASRRRQPARCGLRQPISDERSAGKRVTFRVR